jgi:hypothetical protein
MKCLAVGSLSFRLDGRSVAAALDDFRFEIRSQTITPETPIERGMMTLTSFMASTAPPAGY